MSQVTFAGTAPQERATAKAAPCTGAMERVDVPDWPSGRFKLAGEVVIVKSGLVPPTVWVSALDVLAANVELPEYCAVMECAPCDNADVENVAAPLVRVPAPICVAPSRKLTVPEMVPGVCDVTAAVNVTDWPVLDGFGDEVRVVEVAAPVLVPELVLPTRGTVRGLPGALVVMKTCPFKGKSGKVSSPGANAT
jgi:hypothetical protein